MPASPGFGPKNIIVKFCTYANNEARLLSAGLFFERPLPGFILNSSGQYRQMAFIPQDSTGRLVANFQPFVKNMVSPAG